MSGQAKKSSWVLVKCSDLPVLSSQELEALRSRWVGALVLFLVGEGQWRRGKVYEITKSGEVRIAVQRSGTWVHGRVIRFEYIPRVLRFVSRNT
ncbi:MAG TPA: hypothetical protein VFV38_04565 [Ktedonobacteraceae bacterium]|nr:hypothetical protein [Ktedonobacteraceae bacterium]